MKGIALFQGEIIANEYKYSEIVKKKISPEPASRLISIKLGTNHP
jgi:hypothetical protein